MATTVGNRAPTNEPITSHFTDTALPVDFMYFKILYITDKKRSVSTCLSSLKMLFTSLRTSPTVPKHSTSNFNPLNAELNPIRHLLALAAAHRFVHASRVRVKPTSEIGSGGHL